MQKVAQLLLLSFVVVVGSACSNAALSTTIYPANTSQSVVQLTATSATVTSDDPVTPGPMTVGVIKGRVTNTHNQPIEGALVQADPKTPNVPLHAIALFTDKQGNYEIGLYVGTYDVKFDIKGYKPQTKHVEIIATGQQITLDFVLEPAP